MDTFTASQQGPYAQASQIQGSATPRPTMTFLGLPTDVRLLIYDWVFYSTTLEAERDEAIPEDLAKSADGTNSVTSINELNAETDNDDASASDASDHAPYGNAGPLFLPPVMTEQLNLVCRLLNEEIDRSWHMKVTYRFPCTVAFIDVLSQWLHTWKFKALRHVYVCAYPLPLNRMDQYLYVTHSIADALTIFPGLRLDLLTVENIWLEPDGEEVEGWCLGATYYEVDALLASSGWKELSYVSGTLGFLSWQVQELHEHMVKIKRERNEEAYSYKISKVRPRLCGIVNHDTQGNKTENDTPEDKAEVAEWEAQNPGQRAPEEKAIQVWAKRGTAQYAQDGQQRTDCIADLLASFTWLELRESGEWLINDGTVDPWAHL